MRRLLLIDHDPTEGDFATAAELGATEIVVCPGGVSPNALGVLTMGYHEIAEPGDE